MSSKGITGRHKPNDGRTEEWLTPPIVLLALTQLQGSQDTEKFGLDPCAPTKRPWDTALKHLTKKEDGYATPWPEDVEVFMNPPYGTQTERWLEKLANHGNGIALIFARTETRMFHKWVWRKADGLFFFYGRLKFFNNKGKESKNNSGGPSVLVAYGARSMYRLRRLRETNRLAGHLVYLKPFTP